jgi:hypothetical protein
MLNADGAGEWQLGVRGLAVAESTEERERERTRCGRGIASASGGGTRPPPPPRRACCCMVLVLVPAVMAGEGG